MKLSKIIEGIEYLSVDNFFDVEIQDIAYDSREVSKGTLFFALTGEKVDGHSFIRDAVKRGAAACVVEEKIETNRVPIITVHNSREILAHIAPVFFEYPSHHLLVVGITGTNGKTTTSFLTKRILDTAGKRTGIIGTIGCFIGEKKIPLPNTTPESLLIQRIMREMVDSDTEVCIMEVSSHGIKRGRIYGIDFDFGILTNVSRDHLDFHPSYSDYVDTKVSFFKGMKDEATSIINRDDKESIRFLKACSGRSVTYGLEHEADYWGRVVRIENNGMDVSIIHEEEEFSITSPLRGRYNVFNLLPAFTVSHLMGVDIESIKKGINTFTGVPGRSEVVDTTLGFNCIIDYAHTPDALYNLFSAERELTAGRLICVFGAGGDRDKGKRSEMGRVAASLCDEIILTSDNPRSEDPEMIISDILKGINGKKPLVEIERKRAIELSLAMAEAGDTVVIAGKGHEDYQEIQGERFPFNDKEFAKECIVGLEREKNES
jgi:UDP-N-acetylmuramoyl-L-alanyl-D-glutamate--2,6-diaminopimelate ligase